MRGTETEKSRFRTKAERKNKLINDPAIDYLYKKSGSWEIDFGFFTAEEMVNHTEEGIEFYNSQLDGWKRNELLL